VVDLLKEYKHMFLRIFLEMKCIVGSLREMKIHVNPDANSVKRRPYRLNPKYKGKKCKELAQTLEIGIIVNVEDSYWISLMVVKPKKKGDLRICVDM
jgi:hypothetical protein